MQKFFREIAGQLLLIGAFTAVTACLVRLGHPDAFTGLYITLQVVAFLMFSLPGAVALALAATFVLMAALLISQSWFLLPAMASFWIAVGYLSSITETEEYLRGEFNMLIENEEKKISSIQADIKKADDQQRYIRERNKRYRHLSSFATELGKTFEQKNIYSLLRSFLKKIFPHDHIQITSKTADCYSRWVKTHATPLLVEDTDRDYRFNKIIEGDMKSLIECPLTRGGSVFGLIRVDRPEPDLSSADLRVLSAMASLTSIALEKARLFSKLEELSVTDSLTQLYTNSYFKKRLEEEVERAARYNQKFSVVIFDIDDFKKVNDTYGHASGDKILKEIAHVMTYSLRDTDILGRYGGEEFAAVLINLHKPEAVSVAEKIRKLVEALEFRFKGDKVSVTVTAGVSFFPERPTSSELIRAADSALYKGKGEGKNRVVS